MKNKRERFVKKSYMEVPVTVAHKSTLPLKRMDAVVVEEPLEIRIVFSNDKNEWISVPIYTTMRTPGEDEDLVFGLLFSEGIIKSTKDVEYISYCENVAEENLGNVINVFLRNRIDEKDLTSLMRTSYINSACGLCGKLTIEYFRAALPFDLKEDMFTLYDEYFYSLTKLLRDNQKIFLSTGGTHACAIVDLHGNLLAIREDVGRHNAMDKLIGHMLRKSKIPLKRTCVIVSGRASFELVQKAIRAGIPVFVSIGAPSSLSVKISKEFGLTLIGFLSDRRFVVYNDEGRIMFNGSYKEELCNVSIKAIDNSDRKC